MSQVSAKPRKMTTRETYGKMIMWATQNKDKLHNRRFSEVCNSMRKQFNGEFLSDEAVEDACNTCGITVVKQKKSTFNKKDQLRAVTKILAGAIERIEKSVGERYFTIDEKLVINAVIGGKTIGETPSETA